MFGVFLFIQLLVQNYTIIYVYCNYLTISFFYYLANINFVTSNIKHDYLKIRFKITNNFFTFCHDKSYVLCNLEILLCFKSRSISSESSDIIVIVLCTTMPITRTNILIIKHNHTTGKRTKNHKQNAHVT